MMLCCTFAPGKQILSQLFFTNFMPSLFEENEKERRKNILWCLLLVVAVRGHKLQLKVK